MENYTSHHRQRTSSQERKEDWAMQHIRTITKTKPAPARQIEEVLDIIYYVVSIISSISALIQDISTKSE